jgi:murein DD-endopeptidase MepM/ murein hydrolase activator NlpD
VTTLYNYLVVSKGKAYKPEQIKPYSWLSKAPDVQKQPNEIAGNSRIWGDISIQDQGRVIDLIIEICTRYKLSYREIAYVLLMARVESGLNPDAAAGTTSAAGIGQYTKATVDEAAKPNFSNHHLGFQLDLSGLNVFNAERGAFGILLSYFICRDRAQKDFPESVEKNIYLYHHEGWYFQPKDKESNDNVIAVREIIQTKILPLLDETERLLKENASVQFTLKTADGKPYPNQPFAMVVAVGGATAGSKTLAQPSAVQYAQDAKVVVGVTDGSGKTPLMDVDGLSEVVFAVLNSNYKAILAHFPGRGTNQLTSYKIQSGDTLDKIAREHHTTPEALAKLNNISSPNKISVGHVLRLPGGESGSKPSIWMRRPSMEWLASIIGPKIGAEGVEDTAAVVEHKRSHVVLPNGNKAHDASVNHNNINIAGNKTQAQIAVPPAKKIAHKTNDGGADKQVTAPAAPAADKKVITGLLYPLPVRATADYHSGARRFGSNRGARRHAGIDLYASAGTIVRAMAAGKVIRVYPFYSETYAIEIDHGSFVARYGEVDKHMVNIFVKGGDSVERGEKIGVVGRLVGVTVPSNMLHLEMYASTNDSALTVKNNPPYQRRKDLFDPTPSIDVAVME